MKLPSSKEAHIKAMAVGSDATNTVLPSPLCADPMLLMAATLAIFKATLDNPFVAPKDKGQVAVAGDYPAKWLATVAMLVDKSTPTVAALYNTTPRGEGGR